MRGDHHLFFAIERVTAVGFAGARLQTGRVEEGRGFQRCKRGVHRRLAAEQGQISGLLFAAAGRQDQVGHRRSGQQRGGQAHITVRQCLGDQQLGDARGRVGSTAYGFG